MHYGSFESHLNRKHHNNGVLTGASNELYDNDEIHNVIYDVHNISSDSSNLIREEAQFLLKLTAAHNMAINAVNHTISSIRQLFQNKSPKFQEALQSKHINNDFKNVKSICMQNTLAREFYLAYFCV